MSRKTARACVLVAAAALAGCASGPRNPLHVSFEELGYAGEDFGSLFGSVKYRSVVNIAGLAPISSVGGLHNRPTIFSQLNPQRLFRDESLPDYYSLGITMECSKILELIFDDGVTKDDVWNVRDNLQKAVGKARRTIAQVARKSTASALVGSYRQVAQELQAMDASKLTASTPPVEVERERLLRRMLLDVLQDGASDATQAGLATKDADQLDAAPTADNLPAWKAAVQAAARAFSQQAASLPLLNPAQVEDAIAQVSAATGTALRKGIVVTRWYAESSRRSEGSLGSIVGGNRSETRGRQGFLVMGGIRLAQLMIGDDFITYHKKVSEDQTTGVDNAVKEQFLVLYTVGARYRSFFEESASETASSLNLSLTPEQLGAVLDIPLKQSLAGALGVIRAQSLQYERQLRAATEAAEQGFLPPPQMNLYEFRFNTDKLFEHSMIEEKARSSAYLPVYSVRADVVQKGTNLLSATQGGARSRCAQMNVAARPAGADPAKEPARNADGFKWTASAPTVQAANRPPEFGTGHWVREAANGERADHVQFHTPVFSRGPSDKRAGQQAPASPAGGTAPSAAR